MSRYFLCFSDCCHRTAGRGFVCASDSSKNLVEIRGCSANPGEGCHACLRLVGQLTGQVNLGQSLALTVIVADTIVAVVGLTLAVQVRRKFGSLDIKDLTTLKR